jgi:glycosyltransferase involved in cell wall biosynthesis
MRVLMATPSYSPIVGGAETVIRNLSIGLNNIGIDTDIMTFNMNQKWRPQWQGENQKIDGIDIIKIPALNWFPMEHSNRMTFGINLIPGRFRNRLKNYDLIHFHGEDLTFPLFAYKVGRPRIFHSHGFSFDFYKRYFLSKLILRNIADLYISISHSMTKEYVQLGIPARKIRYLPNGVNTKIFRPCDEKDNNLILFVGRVTFDKGLHVLLDSLKNVKRRVHLVIIGPPGWDTTYFMGIQQRIIEENKKGFHMIKYLGTQEKTCLAKWYQKASIYVSPSFRESFGMTILEALSCGTAVIATNVGGVSDVVNHGENGILIPPNNASKLGESIQDLLDNEGARNRLARNGRRSVVWRFSQEVIVKRLVKIYKEIVS